LEGGSIMTIQFKWNKLDFVLYEGRLKRFSGPHTLIISKDLDLLINNKEAFEVILNSEYNLCVHYGSGDLKLHKIDRDYLLERKKFNDKDILLYKEFNPQKVTDFYLIELWIEINCVRLLYYQQNPGEYNEVRFDYYDNNLGYNHPSYFEKFGSRVPCAHDRGLEFVQSVEKIDKIIGMKKYRNQIWIGTDREQDFTGETEEIVLDMHNFDEKTYKFFRQHEAFEINWGT
jgi:hypothetical protein